MDKIRLGNDIEMRWSIFTRDGDNKVPYNLEGRALTLSVVNRTGESEIEFFAEGNIVTGVFRGRDQKIIGKHGVILRENNGKDGMRTIDACDAFELVACSCEEALGSSGTIQLFHLTFDSTIGAITGTIDPILNYEAEQAEAERKANEIIRKANEGQRIDNEKQRNVNEILRNTAEEERENAEQERRVNEDLRKADEAERKTNEESRVKSESERVSSEEERLYAESIRVANESARIASEAKRKEAETARIEAEDKRIVSEKNRLSAESSRIANEDSRRANEDSRLSAEAKRVSAEEERVSAELERKAKFASMVVQSTGDATDKVMSQKSVTEALKGKQNKLTAGKGISIDGDVISATLDMDIVRVVDALPSVGEANIIYLVPAEQPSESDLFEEWVWTDRWERIGSAKIDLSDYATKGYVDTKISSTEENLVHKDGFERITGRKQFQNGINVGLFNSLVANEDGVESGAWLDQNENPAPFIVADPSADDHAATKYYVDEGLAIKQDTLTDTDGGYGQRVAELETGKANIQHKHTVADITDFPELYYDATAFLTSGAYPSDKYEELFEAVKAKRTVYATVDEAGHISYVFFTSSANSDGSSSRVLLTTIFADGNYLYLNTFVLSPSGMTPLQESITGKANKATTLAGYGIADAYTKSEVNAALEGKQDTLTAGNGISIKGGVISSTVDSLITPITYAELVALRDSSSLVPGMQYRITDYDFTTTEKDTDSAHKLFDIIVTADSESVLNETARAVHHQYESSEETLTGAVKLYKTDMNGYADEVDTGDYFLLVGKVEIDRVTYYRYDKYEEGANTGRYILLESIDLDSLVVGLDNPLYPVGEGTYGEDGAYVSHSEDAIVSYENGTVTVDSVFPLSNRDIASWELKYTLENTKHSSTDGKGTILWMKDEYRNECNYDFINALFKVYEITACVKSPSLVGAYAIKTNNTHITYGNNSKFVSTFGADNHDNAIKYDGLAKIVLGNSCYSNTFGNSCYSNTFGNSCYYNTFGNDCYSNTFGNSCYYNTFGNDCYSNTFGNDCYSNTFGNYCYSNTFGNSCYYNTFGNVCDSNTFGNYCYSNTFGNYCYSNTFGNDCDSNTFGNVCDSNTFGNYCYYNTFGNDCDSNTFGNSCYSNTFGNDCDSIKFASSSSATTKYNYYRQNHFGDGCQYILFKGAETASSSAQVQNYNFAQGLQGTSSAYLTIDGVRSRAYETKVAKNSSGEIKIYCEADLIQ